MLVQVSQKPNFEHLATLLRRALAARSSMSGCACMPDIGSVQPGACRHTCIEEEARVGERPGYRALELFRAVFNFVKPWQVISYFS